MKECAQIVYCLIHDLIYCLVMLKFINTRLELPLIQQLVSSAN